MKKIFTKRLKVLLIIFAFFAVTVLILAVIFKNNSPFQSSASSKYPYQVYFSPKAINRDGQNSESIKTNINTTYDAIRQRIKYLGTARLTNIGIISPQEMIQAQKSDGSYQTGFTTDGYYKADSQKITFNSLIFEGSSLSSSHITIGHEMLHSYVVSRQTNEVNLVEEGMVEYLSGKYLYGEKGAYPDEVAATNSLIDAIKRTGETDPDATLEKIMFQEGLGPGLDNRFNKYLPQGKTSAFAYLNSLYNSNKFDEANSWLRSVKAASDSQAGCDEPNANPQACNPPKDNATKSGNNTGVLGKILPSTNPETWTLNDVSGLISNLVDLAFLLAGFTAVAFIIYGGLNYLTAYGNEEKATKGKTTITWAIVGLIVIILSKVIVSEIWTFVAPASTLPTL